MSYRLRCGFLVLASIVGMAFAMWLQNYRNLDPCPLCIFQRIGLIGMGVFALAGALLPPTMAKLRWMCAGFVVIAITWSTVVAVRHVWLQYLPASEVPACGPGLAYWLEVFPLNQVITEVLHGSGECAVVDWTLLGLSLPHWSLAYFIFLLWQSVLLLLPRKISIFRENVYTFKT